MPQQLHEIYHGNSWTENQQYRDLYVEQIKKVIDVYVEIEDRILVSTLARETVLDQLDILYLHFETVCSADWEPNVGNDQVYAKCWY